jgi:hypothetical protein
MVWSKNTLSAITVQALHHGLINYIDTKAKWRHPKKIYH